MTLRNWSVRIHRGLLGRGKAGPGLAWFDRTTTFLLLAGGMSAALYLALTLVFSLPRYAAHQYLYDLMSLDEGNRGIALLYAVAVVALFGVYWQSWRHLQSVEEDRAADARPFLGSVVAFGVLYAVVLVWMYPINAIDLFQYFFRSRILSVYGANPFAAAPAQFAGDPYLYVVGEWKYIGSLYGPAWELLAACAAWVSGGSLVPNLLALKAVSGLFYVGSIPIVYLVLDQLAPRRKASGTLLYAWNPLILLEWVGNGHNDAAMMFFVLLAVMLWTRRRHAWVLPVFVVAVLCKAIAAIVIPFFILAIWTGMIGWPARLRWLVRSLILSTLVAVGLCAPFGLPWENMGGILQETSGDLGFSLSATLVLLGREWAIPFIARYITLSAEMLQTLDNFAYAVPRWLAAGALAALYGRQLVVVWRKRQDSISAGTEAFFVVAMLVPSYRMWYLTWSMAMVALRPQQERLLRVGAACLAAAFSGLIYGHMYRSTVLPRHFLGVAVTIVLPVLLPALMRRLRCAQRHSLSETGWSSG